MALALVAPVSPQPLARRGEEIDPALLERAQAGDAFALEQFIRHYQNAVFAFLSRALGQRVDVEDLAQEVFVRAYRALPRFEMRSEARVSTWLLQIAVHLLQDTRKKRHAVTVPLQIHHAPPGHDTPETERQRHELQRSIERAAAQLPSEQRVVLILAEFHGLELQEIAQITETPLNTVKTRLWRARNQMKTLMQPLLREEG
jgi:RNA polymerase sigma-70 factor (ECF subfamily)